MNFENEFDRYYKKALEVIRRGGSTADVYKHIDSISDDDYRNSTFGKMASFLVYRGELDEALRFCNAIQRPLVRADALFEVARVLVNNHFPDKARLVFRKVIETASAIKDYTYDTAAIFVQVADELERLGEKSEALDLVHRAINLAKPKPQPFEAGKALRGCARILAQWNRLPEAIEVAKTIELPELRETALEEIHGGGQWPVHPHGPDR